MIDNTKIYGFDAVAEDQGKLIDLLANNENLFKILYYTDKTPLKRDALTAEQKQKFIQEGGITGVPNLEVDRDNKVRNVIFIENSYFTVNKTNPAYLDSILTVDILSHVDNWSMYDRFGRFSYRPYAIAQIIKDIVDGEKFSGIGKAEFLAADSIILTTNPDYAGLTLKFKLINSRHK